MGGHLLTMTMAAVLTWLSLGAQEARTPVMGLWLGTARSAGGLGNWLEFRPGGTAQFSFGAVVEGAYRVSDGSLYISSGEPPAETPGGQLEINGDMAVRTPPAMADAPRRETLSAADRDLLDRMTRPIQMRRVDSARPATPPIVGTWQYAHPTGATAFETFTKAGTFLLRVQMQTMDATYAESPNGVRVKLPSGELFLQFTGDVLVSAPQEPETPDGPRAEGMVFRRAPQ